METPSEFSHRAATRNDKSISGLQKARSLRPISTVKTLRSENPLKVLLPSMPGVPMFERIKNWSIAKLLVLFATGEEFAISPHDSYSEMMIAENYLESSISPQERRVLADLDFADLRHKSA